MKTYPDKGETKAKIVAVNEAYEVLSDPGASPVIFYMRYH